MSQTDTKSSKYSIIEFYIEIYKRNSSKKYFSLEKVKFFMKKKYY